MTVGKTEKIHIKKFLFLSEIEAEIRRYNVIIGPQGSGKSVLAKLIAFCRKCITTEFINSLQELEDKRTYNKRLIQLFQRHFPRYSWEQQPIDIYYVFGENELRIRRKDKNSKLSISINTKLTNTRYKILKDYERSLSNQPEDKTKPLYRYEIFHNSITKKIERKELSSWYYVPATRSYFSTLEKRIFSFISEDNTVDPLLSNFGSLYEEAKFIHEYDIGDENSEYCKKIEDIAEDIVGGKYIQEKREDWLVFNERRSRKIKLIHASSGQQEVMPMLLVLSRIPGKGMKNISFIVEEPESHLFPSAQKRIMDAFAYFYNTYETSKVFITTHSPYILSSINNQLFGYITHQKRKSKKLEKIISSEYIVNPKDVSAFYMHEGKLRSILDAKTSLINIDPIDKASEQINLSFEEMLEFNDGQ